MSTLVENVIKGTTELCEAQNELNKEFDTFKDSTFVNLVKSIVELVHSLDHSIDDYLRAYKTLREATKNSKMSDSETSQFILALSGTASSLMKVVDLHKEIQEAFRPWIQLLKLDVPETQSKWPVDTDSIFRPLTTDNVPVFANKQLVEANPIKSWETLQKSTDGFVKNVYKSQQDLCLQALQQVLNFEALTIFERSALNKFAASKKRNLKLCDKIDEKSRNSMQLESFRSTLISILQSTHNKQFGLGPKEQESQISTAAKKLFTLRSQFNSAHPDLKLEWSDFDLRHPLVQAAQGQLLRASENISSAAASAKAKAAQGLSSAKDQASKGYAAAKEYVSNYMKPKEATKAEAKAPKVEAKGPTPKGPTLFESFQNYFSKPKPDEQKEIEKARQETIAQLGTLNAKLKQEENAARQAKANEQLAKVNAEFAQRRKAQELEAENAARRAKANEQLAKVNAEFAARRKAQEKIDELNIAVDRENQQLETETNEKIAQIRKEQLDEAASKASESIPRTKEKLDGGSRSSGHKKHSKKNSKK